MHARAVVATPAAAFDTGSIAAVSRHLFTPPSKPWPSQQQAHARCRCASNRTHCAIGTANSHISSRTASRAVCCRAKAASATATVAAAAAAASASPELEPQVAFLAQLVSQGVLLPILAGWTFVTALSAVARRARQWCDDNPDEPLSMELLGLLPAALESPTRLAVALFVATRVLRNIAAGLNEFIHTFKPQWDDWADAAAHSVVAWLGPFDRTLLRLYVVVAVLAGARVLIKWKTIALEFILHQRAGIAHPASKMWPTGSSLGRRKQTGKGGGSGVSSSNSSSQRELARSPSLPKAAAAAAVAVSPGVGEDVFLDEAAVMQREGSMLSVSMRPRSFPSAAAAAAAVGGVAGADLLPAEALAGSSAAAAASGGAAASAAAGGWAGSSGSSTADVAWPAPGTRGDDAVERLLLPLDSILSWAIAVMAGLFAVQTLGINIQPLLAIGGASSLLIGLATQTLLTNAVMGVSIFLSRPFVPGDSITVQAAGAILVSGVVEKVTPMRTLLRTDDDVLVTLPNKTIAEMIIYNKSRREARNRLVARSWERPFLKFKVKLPQKELQHLQQLQQDLRQVLKRPGIAQQSIEVSLSKFTDGGAEVLLQCLLLVAVQSATGQQLLLDLAVAVRKHGATLVSIL